VIIDYDGRADPAVTTVQPQTASVRIASVQSRGMSGAAPHPSQKTIYGQLWTAIFGFSHFDPLGNFISGMQN